MSSFSSQSSSASPPESPTLVTPGLSSPRALVMSASANGDVEPAPLIDDDMSQDARGKSAIGLEFHSGEIIDLDSPLSEVPPPTSPTRSAQAHQSPHLSSAPHFVARNVSPRSDTGVFHSSSLPSVPVGYRERGHQRPTIETGFIPGTPPNSSTPLTYVPADGKKEPPEYYSKEYPLSNGRLQHYSGVPEKPQPSSWTDSTPFWLFMYFFFNLGLTLFNKVVLVSFPFPYTLTGLHALSGCAGTYIALERGSFTPARLTQKENIILGAFSVLYTINIAVSNISLQLVTVPFHQVVRAATPLFTMFITAAFLRQRFSSYKLVSLLPVVAGVGFATYGDYDFTAWGLILTLLGTFLAALKTVVTNVIQTGTGGRLKLHPLDLLMRMSPLAFIQCVAYGWYTGELERVRRYGATQMTRTKAVALLINGVIACGLNIVSFTANKKAGPLTMTVSANCKQVLTIALAVFLFNLHINFINGIGIFLTLMGGAWYAYAEHREKQPKRLPTNRSEA